jgi:hypothetical protein
MTNSRNQESDSEGSQIRQTVRWDWEPRITVMAGTSSNLAVSQSVSQSVEIKAEGILYISTGTFTAFTMPRG